MQPLPQKILPKVLLDFGGVLGFFDHMISCRLLAPHSQVTDSEEFFKLLFGEEHKQFERGRISPRNFHKAIAKKTGLTLPFEEFATIYAHVFSPIPGIEEIVAQVPEDLRFILSNTDPLHWERIRQLPVMDRCFGIPQQTIRSFDAGARKPEAGIFKKALQQAGGDIGRIIYFDDVPEYVNAWRELGGTAFLFNARVDSPELLRVRLQQYGLVPVTQEA